MVASKYASGLVRLAQRPFTNLSPGQKVLLAVRIGTSFMAIVITITMFSLQSFLSGITVARINCAHLDVAYGLYRSLRSLMTESVLNKGGSSNVLPIDLGLSDSEISILTQYAQNQVSNAPQSFILGSKNWCTVSYLTDFSDMDNIYTNATTRCHRYDGLDFYDYRTLLLDNQLQVILAYAYQSNNVQNKEYQNRVELRSSRYRDMKIIYAIQLAHQFVLLLTGLFVYGTRGSARDLTATSKVTLNFVAIVALTSGLTMIVITAIVIVDLLGMAREIKLGLGDFGILMSPGKLFVFLGWFSLSVACLGMVSWTVPLWCSNPPEEGPDLDEGVYLARKGQKSTTFTVKPYQLRRQPRSTRTSSRLFDSVNDLLDLTGTPFEDEMEKGSFSHHEASSSDHMVLESSSNLHSEHELRKLGEKLLRNITVRQLNGPRRQKRVPEHLLLHKKDTRDLLYGPNPFSNHQYPQSFAKPLDTPALSRAASLTYDSQPSGLLRTRHLLEEQGWRNPSQKNDRPILDDDVSLLDDAEMEYLDNNRFMNNLPK